MKVGTFFSGVGSPEQALRNLGIKHEVEFACDIDKYAKQTYLKNFKPKLFATDITALDMKDLPYVDLLVFGFPCQAFSVAGKRGGFDDTRGTLFYDALRYLKEHRPRYFIAENVKGLLSHDNGKTFQTIIDCLAKTTNYQMSLMPFDNLDYHIHYKVLNTKDFGIPQNRERIFIIGIRDDEDNNFNFPKEIPLELKLKDILQDNIDSKYYLSAGNLKRCIKTKLYTNGEVINYSLQKNFGDLNKSDGLSYCIDASNSQAIEVEEKYYLSEEQQKRLLERTEVDIENVDEPTCLDVYNKKLVKDTSICLTEPHHNNLRLVEWIADYRIDEGLRIRKDKVSPCLRTRQHSEKDISTMPPIIKQNRIRRLTPIECERLQGFPDNFTEGVSDTQRYKQMGNTITVNVIELIIKNLIK